MEKVFASPSRYVRGKDVLKTGPFSRFIIRRSTPPSLRPYRL